MLLYSSFERRLDLITTTALSTHSNICCAGPALLRQHSMDQFQRCGRSHVGRVGGDERIWMNFSMSSSCHALSSSWQSVLLASTLDLCGILRRSAHKLSRRRVLQGKPEFVMTCHLKPSLRWNSQFLSRRDLCGLCSCPLLSWRRRTRSQIRGWFMSLVPQTQTQRHCIGLHLGLPRVLSSLALVLR